MISTIFSIDEIRERIAPVAKKFGLKRVLLFGSYARGDATSESDVDLIIQLDRPFGLLTFSDLVDSFEAALGKAVDCITEDSISLEFQFEIIDDEVLLYAA